MRRASFLPLAAAALLTTTSLAGWSQLVAASDTRPPIRGQRGTTASSADLVELDIVVVDRDGKPIQGLEAKDFQVKEDGRLVDIKTFAAVSDRDTSESRQLVLLLDDSSVPMTGTSVVQAMAQVILSKAERRDEVTVVRLSNERDEPFGDFETAVARISQYHAGAVPFQNLGTSERALKVVANVSQQLEVVEHRRKLVVCIGGPRVCNVLEPSGRSYSAIWPEWVRAVTNASRANVAVHAVMPVPSGTFMPLAGGLVESTGGSGFLNPMNFEAFVESLWRDASEYYLVGYWPTGTKRELHSIDVKVARKGVRVRARRQRG